MPVTTENTPFLDAARGARATRTPVWFMRQAGRSLPEYRAIRGDGSILDAIKRPELAAEITLQPVRRYGVDAAVLFSDIVVPAHAVGFGIDVAPGTGPVAEQPLRTRADLERLRALDVDDVDYVVDTVRLLSAELSAAVPLLAFAGAPFTVASYLIEGRPSRDYRHTKALIQADDVLWHEIMERLAESAITFIDAQLSNGARAYQLFDSWAGSLSRLDYDRFVLPHSRRVFDELRCPPSRRAGDPFRHRLRPPPRVDVRRRARPSSASTGAPRSARRVGASTPTLVVQGNLDPALVLAGTDAALAGAAAVLADNDGAPGHIFNLGHGVSPDTDPDVLQAVVDLVHEQTTTGANGSPT